MSQTPPTPSSSPSPAPSPSRPTTEPSPYRRHRLAAGVVFFVQGLLFISLTTRLPQIQRRWDLDELAVSGLLLMVVLLAGLGSVAAEVVAHRASSAVVVRVGLLVAAVWFATLLTASFFGAFVGGLAVYGLALGLVDASSNMQAVTVEHYYGRPILPSFHAFWTAGGIAGTIVTLATADVALGPGLLPLTLLPLLALAAPFVTTDRLPQPDAVGQVPDIPDMPDIPWRRIALLGLAMVLFYMVDTAATTWGPVYLDGTLHAPSGLTALATLPYLVATLLARTLGDGLVDRHGAVWLLRGSGLVAAAALSVVVFAPSWGIAVVGFTLLGASVATIAPLSFSAAGALAGSSDPARVDQVVARFNQFNYVGALLGAVLTGVVGAENLRIGFAVPMVLILGIIPLAAQFSVVGRRVGR
ncbi:MAG: MFS transporter [Terracoccus sp.]